MGLVQVCGPVQVNGIYAEDLPSHMSGHELDDHGVSECAHDVDDHGTKDTRVVHACALLQALPRISGPDFCSNARGPNQPGELCSNTRGGSRDPSSAVIRNTRGPRSKGHPNAQVCSLPN
jgi:hypothetical protein